MFKVTTSGLPACTQPPTISRRREACGILKRHNFRIYVSLGSAETLVRRGGIINYHSIAYCLSNISAKNYRNRLMWVESIVCNSSVVFLRHSVVSVLFAIVLTLMLFRFVFDTQMDNKLLRLGTNRTEEIRQELISASQLLVQLLVSTRSSLRLFLPISCIFIKKE